MQSRIAQEHLKISYIKPQDNLSILNVDNSSIAIQYSVDQNLANYQYGAI